MKTLVVCLDEGKFDVPLYETTVPSCARLYHRKLRKFSKRAKIKPKENIRELKMFFIQEEILTRLEI